ncbi:peptide chain release factor N(5)-glutamine methyltransferase [Corynebacterium tuberculostearicum]|uniref:peptide chain release factor N(5)-glutamine methyltransferase n=1 Tax=Corynebacterium tuberculostearicum TaxID=38304 RepID=UPI002026D722|nr:peptide chain release factor N(5)-glutamine methyltransferase [Corynebacterium tuberculostearicum]
MNNTYGRALRRGVQRLRAAGVASPEWDARIMAAHLMHCGHMDIPLDQSPMPGFDVAFDALLRRREAREPLQYVLGSAWFGPLELKVGPGVFIPRPETEVMADWAVRNADGPRLVDLCTGTGALALYLHHYLPEAQVRAVELADAALTYTHTNVRNTGVEVIQADATADDTLADWNGTVDLLVTNPPYVPETPDLDPEVYHDPHNAVFAGADGMGVITGLIPTIARLVRPGGKVAIEHDDSTSEAVQAALARHGGFKQIAPLQDLTGTSRFVTAVRGVD